MSLGAGAGAPTGAGASTRRREAEAGTGAGVPCAIMRGGTSKGAYFLRGDLPSRPAERDDLILRMVGSPHPRQIDGIGGAHPLTTKVAVVGPAAGAGSDVDYLFLQPSVDEPAVGAAQTCGNLLAGVGPFAVERGLVAPAGGALEASVRIRMLNAAGSGARATAVFPLGPDGMPEYRGGTAISGVPGTAAAVRLDFAGTEGASCGALLPTGNPADRVAGTDCTLIDNGMPTVVVRAADVGATGHEDCAALEADDGLRRRLEELRLRAGPLMNLGDVSSLTVPKMTMVAPPRAPGADLCTRTFIPHRCHEAIGVLGAVSTATAALLEGTTARGVLSTEDELNTEGGLRTAGELSTEGELSTAGGLPGGRQERERVVCLEHPSGTLAASVRLVADAQGRMTVGRAGIIRTARKLAEAVVFPRPRTTRRP